MENDNGKILHGIALDLAELKRNAAETKNIFAGITSQVQNESSKMDQSINMVGRSIAAIFTAQKAKEFASEIINVRGEIESLETSYRVLLGNKEKADKMLSEMKQFSIVTPLTLMDISNAGQTLLQFGIEGNKIMPTLKMLGDVSSGNTEKFQRLSLAFGQMSSTGHLMGQDLLQMINAGFNPLKYISEETGKSMNVLRKEMEGGQISTAMVEKAFATATGEGGKFHNMLEKQSHTIKGLQSNLQDIITNELNNFGKANEDLIKGGLEGAIELVKNYKEIGQVIGELIAGYGIYRAALVSITVVQEVYAVQTALAALETGVFSTAQIAGATATNILSAAMARLNVVFMANPYAVAAAAIAALAVVTYDLATAETEAEKVTKRLSDSKDKYQKGIIEEQAQIDILFMKLREAKKGTEEYNSAKSNIISQYGQYLKGLGDEKTALDNVALAYKTISENAIESAKSRALSAAVQNETSLYGESVLKLQKRAKELLTDRLGEAKGSVAYESLAGYLAGKDDKIPNQYKRAIVDSFKANTKNLPRLMGMDSGIQAMDGFNPLENIRNQSKDLDGKLKNIVKSYMNVYGVGMNPVDLGSGKNMPTETGTGLSASDRKRLENEAARLKEEAAERQRKIDEINKDAIQNLKDGQLEIDQAKIDAMDEGLTKELAQIDMNYQKMKAENAKRLDDMIKAEADKQELLWEAANPELVKKGQKFNRSTVGVSSLSEAQLAQVQEFYKVAANLRISAGIKANDKEQEEILKSTKETEEKKLDISLRYSKIKGDLEALKLKASDYKTRTEFERAKLNNDLNDLINQKSKLEEFNKAFPSEQTALDIKEVDNQIVKLKKDTDDLDPKRVSDLLTEYNKIASSLSSLSGIAGEFGASLSSGLSTAQSVITTFNDKNKSNEEKNLSYFTSALNTVIDLTNMVIDSYQKRKESEKEYYQDSISFAHQYALALNEQLRIQTQLKENGFVKNYAGEITDSFNALTDATGKYDEAIQKLAGGQVKTGQKNAVDWQKVVKGGLSAGIVGAAVGFFGGKNKEDVFSDLKKTYPLLVSESGKLNTGLAKTLISTNQLNDETKQLVQNAIDWSDAIDQANQQISSIVNELAGDLGSTLKDSIVGAWKAGEDASDSMFKAASDSLENFVTNMIYSTVFSGVFDTFKNSLKESLMQGGDQNVIDDYQRFMKDFLDQQDAFKGQMNAVKSASEAAGFKFSTNDSNTNSTATPKGIAQASQDSVDELNGRFTAVQGHTFSMSESLKLGVNIWTQQLNALNKIDTNTAKIEGLSTDMKSVKVAIEDIRDRGIKLKN